MCVRVRVCVSLILKNIWVYSFPCIIDTVYDEKKAKERKWEKKQAKLKDVEEARKKQESKAMMLSS